MILNNIISILVTFFLFRTLIFKDEFLKYCFGDNMKYVKMSKIFHVENK